MNRPTHPYALIGRVASGDTIREEPLDGYGIARAERDFRARPDGVSYDVRGLHGGPRSYANAGGVWESVPFRGGPSQDWERRPAARPPYTPHYAPGELERLEAMSAREEARMGRLMRGRMKNPGEIPDPRMAGRNMINALGSVEAIRQARTTADLLAAHPEMAMRGETQAYWSEVADSIKELFGEHGSPEFDARHPGSWTRKAARRKNPLVGGCSQKSVSENIRRELHAHPTMAVAQGAAIAYSHARQLGCRLDNPAELDSPTQPARQTTMQALFDSGTGTRRAPSPGWS